MDRRREKLYILQKEDELYALLQCRALLLEEKWKGGKRVV